MENPPSLEDEGNRRDVSQQQPQTKNRWWANFGKQETAVLLSALIALLGVLGTQLFAVYLGEESRQDTDLRTYLDDIGDMLLDEDNPLPEAEPDGPMSSLARAKTLTILERLDGQPILDRLDGQRKKIVLQFLYESRLIDSRKPVVALRGANLTEAGLKWTNLSKANLSEAYLYNADLFDANLSAADLTGTDLRYANLNDADLSGADLNDADLSRADLSDATGVTDEQLAEAKSLEGATMPDGSKHV